MIDTKFEDLNFELPPEKPQTDLEKWLNQVPDMPTNYELNKQLEQDDSFKSLGDIETETQTKLTYQWEFKF